MGVVLGGAGVGGAMGLCCGSLMECSKQCLIKGCAKVDDQAVIDAAVAVGVMGAGTGVVIGILQRDKPTRQHTD